MRSDRYHAYLGMKINASDASSKASTTLDRKDGDEAPLFSMSNENLILEAAQLVAIYSAFCIGFVK